MSSMTASRPMAPQRSMERARPGKAMGLATNLDPIRVLRRHMWGIVGAAVLGGVLGVAAFMVLERYFPQYTGQVMFKVQPGIQNSRDVGTVDMTSEDLVFRIAQTETYLLRSRPVLDTAMKSRAVQETTWAQAFYEVNPSGSRTFALDKAVDKLEKQIGTGVIRGSNLFSLSWAAENQTDVPVVLNAIKDAYMDMRKARDLEVYDYNLQLLQAQLGRTQTALQDLTTEISSHIREARITDLERVSNDPRADQRRHTSEQLALTSTSLNMAETSYNLVSEKLKGTMEPSPADVMRAERDPMLENTMVFLVNLKTEERRLRETRHPDDPQIRNMEIRVRSAEAERDAKIKEIIQRNLNAELKELSDSIERFTRMLKELEREAEEDDKYLRELAAEYSKYESLKVRREHLEAQRTADLELINEVQMMRTRADAARVNVALEAITPRAKSFPKIEIIAPLGVLVLVALTLGIVFLRELMDQRVKSTSDLAVIPGAHILGAIPELGEDPTSTKAAEQVLRKHPHSVLAESYRQACTPILMAVDRMESQTLLLVGGLPGAGTTTVATNVAVAAAAAGRKVLLVDANFRRPRLAQAMDVPADGPGFGDLLAGAADIDATLLDAGDGIHVMPAGSPANRVFDRLNNGRFESIVAELRGRYDLIVFDAPPAVVAGDAMVLANRVDAAVLIARAHQEHRGLVARLINQLSDSRCELLGVLLNRPRGTAGGYLRKNYATMAQYTAKSA